MPDIINTLLSMLSPKEAEAKIVGHPEAMKILTDMYNNQQDTYITNMYKKIIAAAQNKPQTVEVHRTPGLSNVYGAAADYQNQVINYDPQYSKEDVGANISHELVHFLNSLSSSPLSTDIQHQLIQSVLGSSTYKPYSQLKDYQQPLLTDEQALQLKNVLGE